MASNILNMLQGNSGVSENRGKGQPGNSFSLMDRFMNPMTQFGLATLTNRDPIRAMYSSRQYQQDRMQMPYEGKLQNLHLSAMQREEEERAATDEYISQLPPDQQALARMDRRGYVKNVMSPTSNNPISVGKDSHIYDPTTGEWISPPKSTSTGTDWTLDDMRQEFDYSKYTPDSIQAAEKAKDPSLMKSITPVNYGDFSKAREAVEKRLLPTRQGQAGLDKVFNQLKIGGGAADLGATVGFTKALDPGSVAREGEVSLVRSAEGFIEELKSMALRAKSQGLLTPLMRKNMHRASVGLQKVYQAQYETFRKYYANYAAQFNFPKDLIMGPPMDFPERIYEPLKLPKHPLDKIIDPAIEAFSAQEGQLTDEQRKQTLDGFEGEIQRQEAEETQKLFDETDKMLFDDGYLDDNGDFVEDDEIRKKLKEKRAREKKETKDFDLDENNFIGASNGY